MEENLSILTEKQKTAYLLRQEGMTYKAIAEKMGVTSDTASQHVKTAERRFREYERLQAQERWGKEEVSITITRIELEAVMWSLKWIEDKMIRHGGTHKNPAWREQLPFAVEPVNELFYKTQQAMYGRIIRESPLDRE